MSSHGRTLVPEAPADGVREGCPSTSQALDAFRRDRELAGIARATVRSQASYLKPLRADSPVSSITADELRALILARMRRSQNTARAVHTAFDAFFTYCHARRWIDANPVREIPRPHMKPPKHRYFSREEVAKLYAACQSDENRLIVRLLLLGLRAKELLLIEWGDIDGHALRVRTAKGGRPRRVWLDDETVRLLDLHRSLDGRLIFGCSYASLRERLIRLGRRAGVSVHAHDFRRTFASHAFLAGMNLTSVQQLGGWSSPKMPAYYARSALDEAALRDSERFDLTRSLIDNSRR